MADDALPPIQTRPAGRKIDPLIDRLGWSKADLGRFLGVSRPSVSRWAHGQGHMDERQKGALRFLERALEIEDPIFSPDFGDWALPLGIRGFTYARFEGQVPEGAAETLGPGVGRALGPDEIFEIRQQLGWIQAEMAAFFGVTHSTPAKWEGPDPQVGAATEAELIALREWATRPNTEEEKLQALWQEGISEFMTEVVRWEKGIFPG